MHNNILTKIIRNIIPEGFGWCFVWFGCAFFSIFVLIWISHIVEQKQRTHDFVVETNLERAYTVGYWKGVRTALHYYPPVDKKVEIHNLLQDQSSYREEQKELDKNENNSNQSER